MRYLVFKCTIYYPLGGMDDCVLKTDDIQEALDRVYTDPDTLWADFHIYDTLTGEMVELQQRSKDAD